jgi:hypothetical protein
MVRTLEPRLKAEDLFSVLRAEEKQEKDKKIEVNPRKELEELIKTFEKSLLQNPSPRQFDDKLHEENYSRCEKSITSKYNAKDIEKFSLILRDYQDKKHFRYYGGLYLSVLINNCTEDQITIHMQYEENLFRLAYENKKFLVIHGNAGDELGIENSEEIIVNGEAGDFLGHRNQGTIVVNGNTGHHLGFSNRGKIIINGDTCDGIGGLLSGGSIHLNGKHGRIEERLEESDEFWPVRGEIYHKGKLIAKDGRLV